MLQVSAESRQSVVGGEILLFASPFRDRVDHTADQLLDRTFALGRADMSTEVLGHHDVGRLLRPGLRHFDLALLEYDAALFTADHRITQLPFDLVEGVDAGG
jgi:hypothetical protein